MIVDSSATTGSPSRERARRPCSERDDSLSRATSPTRSCQHGPRARSAETEPLSLCTIGDLILDVVVLPDARSAPDADTPATIRFAAGGQAANVAAWAGALGASSRLICKRGNDVSSEFAAAELAALRRRDLRPGGEGPRRRGRLGFATPRGGRTMASDRGVAALLEASELDPSWVQSCDVLHVSGYCLLREPMAEAAIEAARLARRVTVDLASAHDIEIARRRAVHRAPASARSRSRVRHRGRAGRRPDFDATWVIKLGPHGARGSRRGSTRLRRSSRRHDGRRRRARGRLPGGGPELARSRPRRGASA